MKIIKPWIEIERIDGKSIMKNIEKACRTCYRSENLITEESYKNLIKNCLNRGHESILEHEKITIRMCCDIGVYKHLTRHRFGSFSIESTRYCNYGKDKFDNEIKFIEPCNIEKGTTEYAQWFNTMNIIEKTYNEMTRLGCIPDQMRMILPHSTAAEVVMTANIREWRHILSLRASKMTHPSVQQLMIPLLLYFKRCMPELFEDINYNEEFPIDKYAEIRKVTDDDEK